MRLAYPTGGSGQATVGGKEDVVTLPERTRVRGVNVTAEDAILNGGPHIESLLSLLQLRRSTKLKITNQLPFWSTFEWGAASRKQHVHAADNNYKSEWFDHVLYRVPGSKTVRHGRAALLVKSVDGHQRDLVIVQRLVPANERAGCVLSRFACQRLRWSISARAAHPRLAACTSATLFNWFISCQISTTCVTGMACSWRPRRHHKHGGNVSWSGSS